MKKWSRPMRPNAEESKHAGTASVPVNCCRCSSCATAGIVRSTAAESNTGAYESSQDMRHSATINPLHTSRFASSLHAPNLDLPTALKIACSSSALNARALRMSIESSRS